MKNRSRWLPAAAAAVAAAVMLSACGGDGDSADGAAGATSGKAENTLVIGRTVPIDGMSGDSCYGQGSISTMPMIYGNLLANKPDGSGVEPGLASAYEYDAKALTYTFHIREGAGFSNGDPVTAKDVAFSFKQWRTGQNSAFYYDMIKSEDAVDASTVVVHLTRKDTFLPALLTWCTSTVYPDNYGGQSAKAFFEKPIGAGPFSLVSWDNPGPSETITLAKNTHYYVSGEPKVDSVTIKTSADASQQVLAFQAGDIDVLEQLSADSAGQLPKDQLQVPKPSTVSDLMLNSKKPALADVNVRKAISAALDRNSLSALQEGFSSPAVGILPVNVPNSVPGTTPYTFDLPGAKALMAQTKVAGPIKLKLGFDSSSTSTATMAELIRDQLSQIGIEVSLAPADAATVSSQGSSGNFDLLISTPAAISPTVFDPTSFIMGVWYPNTGANADVITKQFKIGTSTTDDAVKDAAVKAIQDDGQAQSTVIGLVNLSSAFAVASYVKGFVATPFLSYDPAPVSVQ